jgi:hypothetical protein
MQGLMQISVFAEQVDERTFARAARRLLAD